jgi:hypothetical protein
LDRGAMAKVAKKCRLPLSGELNNGPEPFARKFHFCKFFILCGLQASILQNPDNKVLTWKIRINKDLNALSPKKHISAAIRALASMDIAICK